MNYSYPILPYSPSIAPSYFNLSFQDSFYDTESSGKENQTEDSNVRYEDDFEKEDDAHNKRTQDEEDVKDKIKVSERPDTIFTNDKADFGSTRTGGNGTTVGKQDMSPVSRSRQLRALGIEDSPPANTLPSANVHQLNSIHHERHAHA